MTVRSARIGPSDFHPAPGNLINLEPDTMFTSLFYLRAPGPISNIGHERIASGWRKSKSLSFSRAHVSRHEIFHHLDSIVEGEHRLLERLFDFRHRASIRSCPMLLRGPGALS